MVLAMVPLAPPGPEKMTDHFLTGPDLGKRAVEIVVHVDPKGLLFGRENDTVAFHVSRRMVCYKGTDPRP